MNLLFGVVSYQITPATTTLRRSLPGSWSNSAWDSPAEANPSRKSSSARTASQGARLPGSTAYPPGATAEKQDCAFNLPEEIARRKERKARIEEAMAVIESRHAEKLAARKEEYEEKVRARDAARKAGKKPRGSAPKPELSEDASAKERMAHKLKSPAGAKLYGLRKQTVEPVFGIIKQCMRFRQFLMRGKENVAGEWNLVCTAYNLKRTFNLIRSGAATALSADLAESA